MSADVAMTDAPDEQMEETAELSQELKDWKLRLKREGKKTFGDWINMTRHKNAELDPNAKLMPLIKEGLHKVPFEPIPLLSEDQLKLFHIPPASPAEVAAAAGALLLLCCYCCCFCCRRRRTIRWPRRDCCATGRSQRHPLCHLGGRTRRP